MIDETLILDAFSNSVAATVEAAEVKLDRVGYKADREIRISLGQRWVALDTDALDPWAPVTSEFTDMIFRKTHEKPKPVGFIEHYQALLGEYEGDTDD